MKRFNIITISLVISLFCLIPSLTATALALNQSKYFGDIAQQDAQSGLNQVGGGGASITDIVRTVVSVLSWIVGVAAVIMIIVGGLLYIVSGGDSNRVSSAKSTVIYALIGLLVAVLAQTLIHFVLSVSANKCPSNQNISANSSSCSLAQ